MDSKKEENANNVRLLNCLLEMRKRMQLTGQAKHWKVHICSENNFPTAAGLASSAAGYACLAAALAKLYKVEGDISAIARVGSGSACRSTLGGFVRWHKGSDPNGADSLAKQVIPPSHWPEMRILVLVVSDHKKKVSSAIGMKRGVISSELLKYRVEHIMPKRVEEMEQALLNKDFKSFAEITMKDSNQMHAVTLDTYPPCCYMNDISHKIIDLVHSYNAAVNNVKVAYTFDAGPNATFYLLEEDVPKIMGIIDYYFPSANDNMVEYRKGIVVEPIQPSKDLLEKINVEPETPGKLKYMICTRVGDGPKVLYDQNDTLLNSQGLPIKA
ncbi:diphosphomevalonate decarboxylase isoform X2 [Prorops nasuta]|uniref:diphosphomevalonate decarboxylase isoform X2 n=1 Tax=Prorops nasuta TaxID=863751 RepID=UPI0034CE9033